jgi:hypothetical protein
VTQIVGLKAPLCIPWQKWILVLILGGAAALLIQPISALDYANLSYGTMSATPTTTPSLYNDGFLSISSSPSGADVYMDGSYLSSTPIFSGFLPGSHTFRFTKTGYYDYSSTTTVVAGQQGSVSAILIPITAVTSVITPSQSISQNSGFLRVSSSPSGALVYVDGFATRGDASHYTPTEFAGLSPGYHTIKLTKSGYADYSTTITIVAGQGSEMNVDLNNPQSTASQSGYANAKPIGTLKISSSPDRAIIYLNGSINEATPRTINLPLGSYKVKLTKKGYADYTTDINVSAGQITNIIAYLDPLLSVSSSPSGAEIYMDGYYIGVLTPKNITDLTPGNHTLRLTKAGYNPFTSNITISAENSTRVEANLILLGEMTKNPTAETINFTDTPPTTPLSVSSVQEDQDKGESSPSEPLNPLVFVGSFFLLCICGGGYFLVKSRKTPKKILPGEPDSSRNISKPSDIHVHPLPESVPPIRSPTLPVLIKVAEKNASTLTHYHAPVTYLLDLSSQFYDSTNYREAEDILKKAETTTESLRQCESQLSQWKNQGYDTSPLETIRTDDADEIFSKFSEFEQGIERLKKVQQELDRIKKEYSAIIKNTGFPSLVSAVEINLKKPGHAGIAESEFKHLKDTISQYFDAQVRLDHHLRSQVEKILHEISDASVVNETQGIMKVIQEGDLSAAQRLFQELVARQVSRVDGIVASIRKEGIIVPDSIIPIRRKADDRDYSDVLIEISGMLRDLDRLRTQFDEATLVKNTVSDTKLLGLYYTGKYDQFIDEYKKQEISLSGAKKSKIKQDLVFISSKSADYEYVLKLYNFLTAHEKKVFFSQESLPRMGNADYREEIDKAIEQAKHMIVVGSSVENILSPWVKDEWGAFVIEKRSGRKPGSNLITMIIGSVKIDELPISLRMNEVIPFDPDKFSTILSYLN